MTQSDEPKNRKYTKIYRKRQNATIIVKLYGWMKTRVKLKIKEELIEINVFEIPISK